MTVPPRLARPKDVVVAGLVAGLQRVRASTIDHADSQVSFTSKLFRFVRRTNLLIPIDSGTIEVELADGSIVLSYRLGMIRNCVLATIAALVLVAVTYGARIDLSAAGTIGFMLWLWLFGGNYLITLVRFRWFVKRCLREAFARWDA
jgi:hypothetical protein